jgi:hypothetical protein
MKIKNTISFLLLFGLIAIVSQTTLAQFSTTASSNLTAQCDKNKLLPIKCGFYEEGFLDGVADARNNQDNDFKRYRQKFDNQYESFYRNGYEEGYNSIRSNSRWNRQQRDAYDQGYVFGEDDRDRRISRLPRRYEGRYDRVYESFYQQGYNDGYDKKRKQYDMPIGNQPTLPFPNRGDRRRGTATGTLIWNGRVDNRVNITLKADEVKTIPVAGRLSGVYQNLQGVLPRRGATVRVIKLDGRGDVRVIAQPSRANDFTATIEVYDDDRGDDNYKLQITWQSSNVQENYTPGKVTWSGRVDGTVDIEISGDFVEAIDKTASGLTNVRYNLEGYLASRSGSVRTDKKEGRGTVSVIEQPSRNNDYTAVIRIFDPKGGADDYEVEIIW